VADLEPASRPPTDLLTLYEVAERLGVHYMTVYRYVRTGRLDGHKVGVEWRVNPTDLDDFIAASSASNADSTTNNGNGDGDIGGAPRRRRVDYHRRLVDRLVAGDENGSWAIVQNALTAGLDPNGVYLDVISPALAIIGDEWAAGRLTIGEEHQASVVVHRLIGRLGPLFTRRGRSRGAIVLGAPAGDNHSLPSALFADLLRGVGFSAIDLGANTPPSSFVDTARRSERLLAVAVSATSLDDDTQIAAVATAVHAELEAPVVLGGGAIRSVDHARALGADHWAPTTRAALALFAELADDAIRARRRTSRQEAP
jgi:excisionase family DNA binding protein